VNGEKLEELKDGRSLVFTKAGWFTGTATVFPEVKRKSRGLNVFLSKGKRLVARKPLTAAAPVAASFYSFPNISPIW
jgi:hypothetical protein